MFADNAFAPEEVLTAADAQFEPWVRERLKDGRYLGLLLAEEEQVIAGAGIFLADFPPHWIDSQPMRAYILNVYTEKEHRGRGYARLLMERVIQECERLKIVTIVLHASPQGRPVYEKLGFAPTDEMMKLHMTAI